MVKHYYWSLCIWCLVLWLITYFVIVCWILYCFILPFTYYYLIQIFMFWFMSYVHPTYFYVNLNNQIQLELSKPEIYIPKSDQYIKILEWVLYPYTEIPKIWNILSDPEWISEHPTVVKNIDRNLKLRFYWLHAFS